MQTKGYEIAIKERGKGRHNIKNNKMEQSS